MNGLLSNTTTNKPNFFAYDNFECKNGGRFSKTLNSYVKKYKLENLIFYKKDNFFIPVFIYYFNK